MQKLNAQSQTKIRQHKKVSTIFSQNIPFSMYIAHATQIEYCCISLQTKELQE
jgi:hypothetical protein